MKYAILTILDQTIGYRTESGSYTTKHPEAKLWDDLQDASGVASRDTAMAALEIRKKGEFFVEDTDESLVCSVTSIVEAVPDEAEFRSREDTW
jgi:hypothetical protein